MWRVWILANQGSSPESACSSFFLEVGHLSMIEYLYVVLLSVLFSSLLPHGLWAARFFCLWNFPGKNTGVGCHFLLQGSSWPRDWTHISCISYQLCHMGSPEHLHGWCYITQSPAPTENKLIACSPRIQENKNTLIQYDYAQLFKRTWDFIFFFLTFYSTFFFLFFFFF